MNRKEKNRLVFRKCFFLSVICFCLIVFSATAVSIAGNSLTADTEVSLLSGELFSEATSCKRCHNYLTDKAGEEVSFVDLWSTTMMRLSFIDPLWQSKVRSETIRISQHAELIEEKCVRCHSPMASEQATQDGADISLFDDGFLSDGNPYHGLALDGISCTLCHQVTEETLNNEDPYSGHFEISNSRVAFGHFNPDYESMMEKNSGFRPKQAIHVGTSEFCATCHDLYTDYVDKDGNIVSNPPNQKFPEQTPYLEWRESSFLLDGTQCQGCHMSLSRRTKIASKPWQTRVRFDVSRHTFYTENTMMLSIIDSMAQFPGLDLPDFSDAINDGEEYLKIAGSIEIKDVSLENNTLTVNVRVVNEAGHKLPTSIPIRRVFIHLTVYDPDYQVIFSSGDVDSDGKIIGVEADTDLLSYEQHYDTITSGNQVQVYEGIMGNYEEEVTYTLLRASHFKKDNRILPKGFNKTTADERIRPKGEAKDDDNFIGGEDQVTYKISVGSGSEFYIVAVLKDQTLSYPFIADLKKDYVANDNYPIPAFIDEYEHHKVHFEIIDEDTRNFPN